MGRSQQKQGSNGEQFAENKLRQMGVYNLAKIPTPSICRGGRTIYLEKVLGDRRGELANGISVLAEVKTTLNKNLRWSAFSGEHQPQGLSNHLGLSLLVWVCDTAWSRDIFVMRWGDCLDAGFRKGKGITPEMGVKLNLDRLEFEVENE